MTNTFNIDKSRKAYAVSAKNEQGALKAYVLDLNDYLAKIPDNVLREYNGYSKIEPPAGSHMAKIKNERDALNEALLARGIDKKSLRMYWLRVFNRVLECRGIEKKGKASTKTKTKTKTKAETKAETEASGYTREKVIGTITQIAAWIRENDAPDFNASETMKGLELALKGLNKVIINK